MGRSKGRALAARAVLILAVVSTAASFLVGLDAARALPTLPPAPSLPATPAVPSLVPAQPLAPLGVVVDDTVKTVEDLLKLVGPAQTALQAAAASLQADVDAVVAGAQEDPAGVPAALQTLVLGSLGGVVPVAFRQAVALAAAATQPICPALGAVAAETASLTVPTMPDYSLFGPLAGAVRTFDRTGADTVRDVYATIFARLLSPVALPDALSPASPYVALAQALLGLLKVNWHSTYFPVGGGAAVVHDTPGFLGLPALLDVDGNLGFDVCAKLDVDLTTGAIAVQIDRIPLADPNMRAAIQGQFLGGVIAPGYDTLEGSHIPSMFEGTMGTNAAAFNSKVNVPGESFVQTLNLTSALQYRIESEDTPLTYSLTNSKAGGPTGNGTLTKWLAPTRAKSFSYATAISTLLLGVGAANPTPTNFEYCTSAKGFCSNQPGADPALASASMHFVANTETDVLQFGSPAGKTATSCPGFAILGDAHVRGTRLYLAQKTSSPGFAWFDTDDLPIQGCLATASTTGTLPAGTTAQDRLATFAGTGSAPPITATAGTMVCPAGLTLTGGSAGVSFGLARYLCPPV